MSSYTDEDERNDNSGRQWETPLTATQRAMIAEQQALRDATVRFFAAMKSTTANSVGTQSTLGDEVHQNSTGEPQ